MIRQLILGAAIALAASQAAAATNLVANGDFEVGYTYSTEFNTWFHPDNGPTGWTSQTFYAFNLYLDPATATTVETSTQYIEGGQKLATSFYASPTGGKFVALDGVANNRGPLTQEIDGLTPNKRYVVGFDWGATQLQNRQGQTTEQLIVGFGNATQATPVVTNASQGFTGWQHEAFTFNASGASQLLSFLSLGTPLGLPPMAVLDGVSVTAVPEPAVWGLLVVGFGLVGFAARRRRAIVVA